MGPTDAGKSSLSKILLGYAARTGSQPTFVDLDIGQGSITAPGSICAAPIDRPIDIEVDSFTSILPDFLHFLLFSHVLLPFFFPPTLPHLPVGRIWGGDASRLLLWACFPGHKSPPL